MYPKSIEILINTLMVLPGVGRKTAERYVLHLLDLGKEPSIEIAKNLIDMTENTTFCTQCHNLAEGDLCHVCSDKGRDSQKVCIVSSPKEVISIEKTGQFNGLYHVLGGLISTRKGIMPDDLHINDIQNRINNEDTELILGLNATVEGETTALYLVKKFREQAQITRLAFGLSIGGQLDYADDLTLLKAFEGRKKM